MKFTKLLALSALWLLGLGANAAELIERTAPEAPSPQVETASLDLDNPAEFVLGNYYVLYNVGAKQFFTEGNSWGTQMSLGDGANLSYFSLPAGKTIEDAALLFNNYSAAKSSWKLAFFDTATAMFVDLGSQANFYWQVIPVEGKEKTYHLQASPLNPNYNPTNNAGFVGAKKDAAAGSALEPFLDEEQWIDWQFISVPEWDAYGPEKALYDKSQELKSLIEKAEDAGIDVNAAVEVYNNINSTIEQMEAVIAVLDDALKNNIANATGQHPQDASAWIKNANFNGGDLTTGWSGDAFGAYNGKDNAEHYNRNYNSYQDVTVKYPGLYLVGVNAFYRAGFSDAAFENYMADNEASKYARLYATVGEETVDVPISSPFQGAPNKATGKGSESSAGGFYIPNNMEAAEYYMHTLGLYANLVPVEVAEADATLRIGVQKTTTLDGDWSIFDDFSLIYCGNGDDRWVGYAKTLAAKYPDYAGTTAVTEAYKTAYLLLKNNPSGTTKDEVDAYLAQLKNAKADLDLNISLWKTFEDSVNSSKDFIQPFLDQGQESVPAVSALNKYLSGKGTNATKMIAARELTNDEIRAELAKLYALVQAVKTDVDIKPGTDMTKYLTNPAFDTNDWTGWSRESKNAGNFRVAENCAEAWNTEYFDVYQEVPGMPVGVYEISTQGFYRYAGGSDGFDKYKQGQAIDPSPTYIYMNANTTSFMNIYAEPRQIFDAAFYGSSDYISNQGTFEGKDTTFYFPNGMSSAAVAFKNDMFVNSAYGAQVSTEDKMRIGVKGSTNSGTSWVIFDNFKLTYWGKQADKVVPALEGALAEMQGFSTGRVGKNVTAALAKAISDAQTALQTQSTDGEALFAALVALYDIKAMAQASREKLDSLAELVATLKMDITAADMAAVLAPAQRLCDQIEEDLSNREISDDDVPGLKEQVNTWIVNAKKCVSLNEALATLGDAMLEEASATWMQKAGDLLEEVNNKIAQGTLTFDEIDDYIEQINLLISTQKMPEDMNLATDANPVNATAMLKTPKFSKWDEDLQKDVNSNDGWTITGNCNFGNDDVQKTALAVEFWHQNFDIHQDVLGLPVGVYEVRCNAMGGYDADNIKDSLVFYGNVLLKDEVVAVNNIVAKNKLDGLVANADTALIFTKVETVDPESGETITKWDHNGASQYIKVNLGETGDTLSVDTLWQPASMVSAVKFFNLPNKPYANSLFVKISEEGQVLRLGIGQQSNQIWPIMDDFELIYYGANSTKQATGETYTAIEEVAAQDLEVVRTEFFTIGGMRTNSMKKGFAIMRQTMSDGSVVVKKVVLK